MRGARHVARIEQKGNTETGYGGGNPKEKANQNSGTGWEVWNGLVWLRIGTRSGLL
jgi:hypothetical protein